MLLLSGVLLLCKLLLLVITNYNAAATLCFGGQDVFTSVRENSPAGTLVANLSIEGDPETNEISLELTGDDADWFYLEEKSLRLNTTLDQVLDREIHGSVLKAAVSCYENDTIQSEYGIMVEILNENDNEPVFLEKTLQARNISELTAVNSVVFALRATDADGDTIIYKIDDSSPDAEYFKIDLPNSGQVLLNKPLDYESKIELHLRVFALEMNTKEHLNTTATLVVHVQDGDDHYPQFLPCAILPLSGGAHVCANPVYTTNITERDKDTVLDFYPGPVHAVDGDEGLNTPVVYSILSGADNGRFLINCTTGEITLTRPVENRLLTPSMRLRIMAAQVDDLKKYSVATAIVRVVAENRFPPQFQRLEYRAFVTETTSPASFVLTYGNELLILHATDQDFPNGMNPKIQYSLETETDLFSITKEGFLIARGNQPPPPYTHQLEVLATDLESGDVAKASISVTVLHRGQPVPHSPLGEDPHYGQGSPGRAVGVMGLCLILLGGAVCVLVRWLRRRKRRQDPADRASVAQGKHPNVVNHGRPVPLLDEVALHSEVLGNTDASQSSLHGRAGVYTITSNSTTYAAATTTTTPGSSAIRSNGKASEKPISKAVSFHDEVIIRAPDEVCEDVRDGGVNAHAVRVVNTHTTRGASTHSDKGATDIPLVSTSTASVKEEKYKAKDLAPPLSKSDAISTISSESRLASQSINQGDTTKAEPQTIINQVQPDQSNLEQSVPESTTQSSNHRPNKPDKSMPDDPTSVESKSDVAIPDRLTLATAEAEPSQEKRNLSPITESPCESPPQTSQDQASAEDKNQDPPQVHTRQKEESKPEEEESKPEQEESKPEQEESKPEEEESKPEEATRDESQQSASHTDDQTLPTRETDVAKGPGNNAEVQHKDSAEETCTNIPEPSTDAVELAGPSAPIPEPDSMTSSIHTQDETLPQDAKPSTGPSSEERTADLNTGTTTDTSGTESEVDAAVVDDSNQGGDLTEPGAEESAEANIKTQAADAASQERKIVPDIIITGTTDPEDEMDDTEEKFTKITNLDDDVTDVTSTDGQ
ncbi:protein dachsous isoform X2 [Alosa sapidissima]|uniref:protein dachsous isoform X2 n=1 Tax=Alosa sapidissima TaxID=34773 RepID=UPI001C0A4501|nr:protein dachsous isoform X2 [Alosa sapidissima]